jgi:hypothetical protein
MAVRAGREGPWRIGRSRLLEVKEVIRLPLIRNSLRPWKVLADLEVAVAELELALEVGAPQIIG